MLQSGSKLPSVGATRKKKKSWNLPLEIEVDHKNPVKITGYQG
jgi:hypothetical protein